MSENLYEKYKVGLIGDKLSHSHSPIIHKILGNPNYKLIELQPQELDEFFARSDFHAINVTIPYKKDVIKYCESISATAQLCNSVNTILNRNGKLYGYNTDFIGFITMLKFYDIKVSGKFCAVLGSGGAGGTAVEVLKVLGASKVVTVSRSGEYSYDNLEKLRDVEIIVNSTPVGLFGRNNDMPIDPKLFPKLEAVADLIANPYRTELMNKAQQLFIKSAGGDAMLFAQAVAGFSLFFDMPIDFANFGQQYAKYRKVGNNLVIIGMPGSGKSTIGKYVAQRLNMRLCDVDAMIEEKANMPIPTIFEKFGESHFRKLECEALNEACERHGYVIVTGGGVVENAENCSRLRRSGMVFCISRPLELLSSAGRPVSQRDGIEAIYNRRKPLYKECADFTIINNKTPQQCCGDIVREFYGRCKDTKLNLSEFTKLV